MNENHWLSLLKYRGFKVVLPNAPESRTNHNILRIKLKDEDRKKFCNQHLSSVPCKYHTSRAPHSHILWQDIKSTNGPHARVSSFSRNSHWIWFWLAYGFQSLNGLSWFIQIALRYISYFVATIFRASEEVNYTADAKRIRIMIALVSWRTWYAWRNSSACYFLFIMIMIRSG